MKLIIEHNEKLWASEEDQEAIFAMARLLWGMGEADITIRFMTEDLANTRRNAYNYRYTPVALISWEGAPEGNADLFVVYEEGQATVLDSFNNGVEVVFETKAEKEAARRKQIWTDIDRLFAELRKIISDMDVGKP